MAVKLNRRGYDHAKALVEEGRVELDDRDDWSEHQPSAADENAFIEEHGYREYGRWFLAIDDDSGPETKGHYKFPYERPHEDVVERQRLLEQVASRTEREGFEPSDEVDPRHTISSRARSAAPAPLQARQG